MIRWAAVLNRCLSETALEVAKLGARQSLAAWRRDLFLNLGKPRIAMRRHRKNPSLRF